MPFIIDRGQEDLRRLFCDHRRVCTPVDPVPMRTTRRPWKLIGSCGQRPVWNHRT
jgi:hypothetical protein